MSCSKTLDSKLQEYYNYYPLETGHYLDYQVDSIFIDQVSGVRDTDSYFIREQIGETFLDNEERETHKLNRYRKTNQQDDWVLEDVWHINAFSQSLEKVEENLRFVKLIYPFTMDETWEGNNYVLKENEHEFYTNWEYRYLDIHFPMTIDSISFDSTTIVDQHNERTDHFWYYGREVYAHNVGMIHKELINLTSQTVLDSEEDWRANAEKGYIITYKLIDFKK